MREREKQGKREREREREIERERERGKDKLKFRKTRGQKFDETSQDGHSNTKDTSHGLGLEIKAG